MMSRTELKMSRAMVWASLAPRTSHRKDRKGAEWGSAEGDINHRCPWPWKNPKGQSKNASLGCTPSVARAAALTDCGLGVNRKQEMGCVLSDSEEKGRNGVGARNGKTPTLHPFH